MQKCLTITCFILILSCVSVVSTVIADESASKEGTPQPPGGYVIIEEGSWNLLADEPDRHIGLARESFLMTDAKTASMELRKAAVHVRIAASHATERAKKNLVYSEHELERMARRIENGTLKSVDEFDLATARALHAMADYQYIKAADAWRKREAQLSGQYLRAAANNLERAAARTDSRMRAASAEVARESRLISTKMIDGAKIAVDDVGAGIEKMGREIEHLGKRVAPVSGDK